MLFLYEQYDITLACGRNRISGSTLLLRKREAEASQGNFPSWYSAQLVLSLSMIRALSLALHVILFVSKAIEENRYCWRTELQLSIALHSHRGRNGDNQRKGGSANGKTPIEDLRLAAGARRRVPRQHRRPAHYRTDSLAHISVSSFGSGHSVKTCLLIRVWHRTIIAIAAILFFHYQGCALSSTTANCGFRTHMVFFAIQFSVFGLSAYTSYLRKGLQTRQQQATTLEAKAARQ